MPLPLNKEHPTPTFIFTIPNNYVMNIFTPFCRAIRPASQHFRQIVSRQTYVASLLLLICANISFVNLQGQCVVDLTVGSIRQPTCGGNDGSFSVTVTGITAPYQYTLSKIVSGLQIVQETGTLIAGTPTFVFLTGGTYKVDVAKDGTCFGTVTVELPQQELVLSSSNLRFPTCGGNDGSFSIPVTGIVAPYQYKLSKIVNGSPVLQENGTLIAGTPTFVFLTGGTYQVDISKGGTCSGSITVELPQEELVISSSNLRFPTCGGNDGSFSTPVTGIVPPYQYKLSKIVNGSPVLQENGTLIAGTPTFVFLTGGTYQVDISKGGTCSGSITVELPQQELVLSSSNLRFPTCGGNDGSFSIPVTGIVPPYQYRLSKIVDGLPVLQENGTLIAGTPTFVFLTGGTYQVDISKSGTCSGSITVELPQQELVLTSSDVQQPTCGVNDGSFSVLTTGISLPYDYKLFKLTDGLPVLQTSGTLSSGTLNFSGLYGGTYQVEVSKGTTCSSTITVRLNAELIGTDGCSPGYWKNNTGAWPVGYSPSQTVETIFNVPDEYGLDNMTFLQALQSTGGSGNAGAAKILLTAAVAAVLNADNCDVDYPIMVDQIVARVNTALDSRNRNKMLSLAKTLDKYNNQYCPINANTITSAKADVPSLFPGLLTEGKALSLSAYPNPSVSSFTVKIESGLTGTISLRVLDIQGRIIEQRQQLLPNQVLNIGSHYKPGVYIVELQQGSNKQQLKLIKAAN
jgi:hypothetical protein